MSALKLVRSTKTTRDTEASALELILMSKALDSFKSVSYAQSNGSASLTIELQAKNDYRWHEIKSDFSNKERAVSVLCEFFKTIEEKNDQKKESIENFFSSINKIEMLDHASLFFNVNADQNAPTARYQ